jgi:GNAT superfamily N-acetyltransferase
MLRRPLVIDTAPMLEFRAAQVQDVSAIAAIDPQALHPREEIEALVHEHASIVALERGEIVGFLALRPRHFYHRDFIDLLFVAPGWRRRGVGRALMRAALRNASTSRVFVSTNESNAPMRELCTAKDGIPAACLRAWTKVTTSTCSSTTFRQTEPGKSVWVILPAAEADESQDRSTSATEGFG